MGPTVILNWTSCTSAVLACSPLLAEAPHGLLIHAYYLVSIQFLVDRFSLLILHHSAGISVPCPGALTLHSLVTLRSRSSRSGGSERATLAGSRNTTTLSVQVCFL